jgi:hypothetical protein
MLKIVPDPPCSPDHLHDIEDILVQLAEYLDCARAIASQNASATFKFPAQALALATLHELEAASGLVETALSKIQALH